jgi:hypothetical protein
MIDYTEMRAFQVREETGYLPDEVYFQDEDDLQDPDHHEIAALVCEQYAATNAERLARRVRDENLTLRALLVQRGMPEEEIDEAMNGAMA